MVDDVTLGVLNRLDATHELHCGDHVHMFNLDFDADVVTIRGASSKEHVVRFPEIRLCDYLNALRIEITEDLVMRTLCDIYHRPEHYGVKKERE